MNETYELCKRLYELKPDWRYEGSYWGYIKAHDDYEVDDGKEICPNYSLEYLLDMLPKTIDDTFGEPHCDLMLYVKNKKWYADYLGAFIDAKGDTPLEATLLLAILLAERKLV